MNWYRRDPQRLEKEIEIMCASSRAELRSTEEGDLFWLETITSETGVPYTLAVLYPERFPFERPTALFVRPSVEGAPHRFSDGSLCLFDNPWAPDPKCTALVVRNRAVVWLLAYEAWRITGKWLAPEHPTGRAA